MLYVITDSESTDNSFLRAYTKMNNISCYKLLLILITWTINFSEQIKHINGSSSIDACKGKDVDLVWKVDEEKDKISKLDWYLNNKTICTSSPVDDFTVRLPYQGRIERINKTGIRLKNVSIDNEGIYILFPLFEWYTTENLPKIELRVLEPPTNKCSIRHPPDFTSELSASHCGRPQVSLVWKRKQTFEVLGEGNDILNSTLQDKEVLCCLDGKAMKCVDDNKQFCTNVIIPQRDNERPSEDGNTQHTNSVTMPGTDTGSTSSLHYVWVTSTICLLILTTIIVLVLFIIICKKRKNKKDIGENSMRTSDRDISSKRLLEQGIIPLPQRYPSTALPVAPCVGATTVLKGFISSGSRDSSYGEECIPMMEMKHLAVEPLIKDDPGLETKAIVHQPMNDSEADSEVQTLHPSRLYPALETAPMLYEHQYSPLITIKEIQELRQAALCKICFAKEISVVFMPCSHIVTCAYCSIRFKQCPVCRVIIKRKMNICPD